MCYAAILPDPEEPNLPLSYLNNEAPMAQSPTCKITDLPAELVLKLFKGQDTLVEAFKAATSCRQLYGVWQHYIVTIADTILPREIACLAEIDVLIKVQQATSAAREKIGHELSSIYIRDGPDLYDLEGGYKYHAARIRRIRQCHKEAMKLYHYHMRARIAHFPWQATNAMATRFIKIWIATRVDVLCGYRNDLRQLMDAKTAQAGVGVLTMMHELHSHFNHLLTPNVSPAFKRQTMRPPYEGTFTEDFLRIGFARTEAWSGATIVVGDAGILSIDWHTSSATNHDPTMLPGPWSTQGTVGQPNTIASATEAAEWDIELLWIVGTPRGFARDLPWRAQESMKKLLSAQAVPGAGSPSKYPMLFFNGTVEGEEAWTLQGLLS